MRLANRVLKLERTEALTGPPSLLVQLKRAMDSSAVRLTGRSFDLLANDSVEFERVLDDLQGSFTRNLSDADLKSLIADLELIVLGTVDGSPNAIGTGV